MQIFVDQNATRDYFLLTDTDKTFKFVIGPIDSLTIFHIRQTVSQMPPEAKMHTLLAEYLRFGLKVVEGPGINFADECEEIEIPYIGKRRVVKKEFIQRMSRDAVAELSYEIAKDNELLPEIQKNS